MTRNIPDYSNFQFIKDIWHFLKFRKGRFLFLTIILAFGASAGLVGTVYIAKIVDLFVSGNGGYSLFYNYLAIIVGISVGGAFLQQYGKHSMYLISADIQKNAKVEAFRKLLQGDLIWHEGESTGAKMEKIENGVNKLGGLLGLWRRRAIHITIQILGIIGVFAFIDLKYAAIALIYMVVYLFLELNLNKKLSESTKRLRIARESSSGKAYEFSSNISTIKALGMEKSSSKHIMEKENDVLRMKYLQRRAITFKWLSIQLVASLFFGLFIFLVGKDILAGILTVGMIVIYIDYVRRLTKALNLISEEADRLIEIKYGVFRMMKIFRMIPDINEDDTGPLREWRTIKINNLGFRYREDKILQGFNLGIAKGEKIGIVGMSGSGKSTLFKLLLKLHLVKEGEILFDKKNIEDISRDSLLKKISVVPQETELFNLSLRENITLSKSGRFNLEKYKKALEISQVSKFIPKLKNKDLTFVGEKGIRLSGGEKQRIGIARAIYKDSDIIILDESTSNLDYANERRILDAIDKKLKNKTLILAAHRLTTLESMDRILFIEGGKIVEEGSYKELIEKRGKFYKLWKSQKRR
ncbi:hypothetical protein CMI41_04280 [Candidatus Pacearchaeota archaeon]|nr:hypothetical protein [Candidatus Pacearchaeota archaeon]|tara:strand:- start:7132 stop:8880 length:1749 start_codon:yes stop_codon:yes gene_type:complete